MLEVPQAPPAKWRAFFRIFKPTFAYWMKTEVHVYGFSIAANVLLSFYPFLIVIQSLCQPILGWRTGWDAIAIVLDEYFPGTLSEFMYRNLQYTVFHRGSIQYFSILLLLFTANGVFEPMEVALNRAWGIAKNRSFLKNQLVSLALIFACGILAMISTALSGANLKHLAGQPLARFMAAAIYKAAAVPVTILILFLIYWLLPNARISWRSVLPQAILAGISLEALKYINLVTWPLLSRKLSGEYGPFYRSVTIILWSFAGSMVVLAGAEWAARRVRSRDNTPETPVSL